MSEFILLEPSCDIHLVRDDFPAGTQEVDLRVFTADFDPRQGRFVIAEIRDPAPPAPPLLPHLQFDFFPLGQTIVNFNDATRTITPGAGLGTVFMQVRFLDPARPTEYHHLVARIEVHERMNGWWFGNRSLSIFREPEVAHSQPSLYALFDRQQPGGGVVGDITGHDYVALTIDDLSICNVDFTIPTGNFKDRLRGLAVGQTVLRGSLLGQDRAIDLRVVELGHLPGSPLQPVLRRENAIFNAAVPRIERHNILFLGDGFAGDPAAPVPPSADHRRFADVVTKASHNLFDSERHAPFNLLRDGFNVWSHAAFSRESGVTCGPRLNADGIPIPSDLPPPSGSPPGAYRLLELLQLVGFPTPADAGRTVAEMRAIWNAPGSIPLLVGYQDARAVAPMVAFWQKLVPRGIPQAVDSFYGSMQGRRWGDRASRREPRAVMVSTPPAADPNFAARHARLAQRMFEWHRPDALPNISFSDPRRFAPEYVDTELRVLVAHASRLADPTVAATDPNHEVGRVWDKNTPANAALTREVNSAGLVCVLVNSEHAGGTAFGGDPTQAGFLFYSSLGSRTAYTTRLDPTTDPNIRRLMLVPNPKLQLSKVVDVMAHEFGHAFNLGDEYERVRGPGPQQQPGGPGTESFDNLTRVETVQTPPPAAGHSPNFPTPVDPQLIKWLGLHRIELSDMLTRRSTINGTRIVVQLAAGATAKWHAVVAQDKRVFLRRLKATAADPRQLPIEPADLFADLILESINDVDGTLTLRGGPPVLAEFPAGSVVYVPKRDVGHDPLNLVETAVRLFMELRSWNPADPTFPRGRALTENHNPNEPGRSDDISTGFDSPPKIPDFDPPCKSFKLIGLYEGGGRFTTHTYRPAGGCKMRNELGKAGEGEFCFVCKYLIVNRVDPGKHALLDARFYPKKKTIPLPAIFGGLPVPIGDLS